MVEFQLILDVTELCW